jgi:hypothetical protein
MYPFFRPLPIVYIMLIVRFRWSSGDQHFVDPVSVHIHDFIAQSADFQMIAGFWYPLQDEQDQPGNGPVMSL